MVVIPCFRVESRIAEVIAGIPSFVDFIVVVNDKSPDNTSQILNGLSHTNKRLVVVHHDENQGVGGATKSGYLEALKLGAEVIVKIDGDGQMAPKYIEPLATLILTRRAEYAKGNRFQNPAFVRTMPAVRKIGNLGLSFLIKIASGYWNIFDPTNGFTAISAKTLANLDFNRLENRYLFESSMLVELYLLGARVKQIAMPSIYNNSNSSLNPVRSLSLFLFYLLRASIRRFFYRYIWQDFTAVSVFVIFGLISLGFGTGFGIYHWIRSIQTEIEASSGTVIISGISIILGFQLLLQAIVLDIDNVPE